MIESVQPVLMSSDIARSVGFFERLGFRMSFVDDGDAPRYAGVERDGIELHLQWHDEVQWTAGIDRPTYRFTVRDVDALHAELERSGA
ncbi:MAG: glyoxalase/bleomycin resistance/extradiol dioxygenase family protein, partial [Gemmatimonadota bacterium]|nr:glyoxalase/bleomycin resistance/extradiol dioxygenase family protein [Gemmatimonadota bacterium]